MMRAIVDLSERELLELDRGRRKRELVEWLRREAASRDGEMAWYVARTNWRADSVADELRAAGIEAVCPKERHWRRYPRSNRRYSVDFPMFGNYCFVRLLKAESAWVGLLTFQGVHCLQGDGERPLPLRSKEIEQVIGLLTEARCDVVREAGVLDVGDHVAHGVGPLAELTGVVTAIDSEKRQAIVETFLFGRAVSTRCGIDDLEKLA